MNKRIYKPDPNCPICQHPQREEVDGWLARQSEGYPPGMAFAWIASQFEDMRALDVIYHERNHRNPHV